MPSSTFYNLPVPKQEKLLEAAWAEFARVPYSEASINRMIRDAGISRGSFYMYFEDKEDLFRFLLEGVLSDFLEKLSVLLRENRGDLFQAFRGLFDRAVEREAQDRERVRQLSTVLKLNAGLQQGPLLQSVNPCEKITEILPEIDRSLLSLQREGDLNDMLHMLFGITMPMLFMTATVQDVTALRERYAAQLDILSRGMTVKIPVTT